MYMYIDNSAVARSKAVCSNDRGSASELNWCSFLTLLRRSIHGCTL